MYIGMKLPTPSLSSIYGNIHHIWYQDLKSYKIGPHVFYRAVTNIQSIPWHTDILITGNTSHIYRTLVFKNQTVLSTVQCKYNSMILVGTNQKMLSKQKQRVESNLIIRKFSNFVLNFIIRFNPNICVYILFCRLLQKSAPWIMG